MAQRITVMYFSTSQGVTQQQADTATIYYGKTFKIAKELFSPEGEVDFQKDVEGLMQEIMSKGLKLVDADATIERYETWDTDGEEVSVMYRVPCIPEST